MTIKLTFVRVQLFAVLLFMFNCAVCAAPNAPTKPVNGYLHRSHTYIVDGDGKTIQLRGINLGNWLLVEPWMTGIGFGIYMGEDNQPDEYANAIVDLVGKEKAGQFFKSWRDNYITQADIKLIKSLGFNSVRVPLDYRLFYAKETYTDIDTGFIYLDNLLKWSSHEDVYVIPDMHSVPGGKLISVPGNIYTEPRKQDLLCRIWRRIAKRYANNRWIGGWDLINEPGRWDDKHESLGQLYKKITSAIREVDKNHLIIVEGDHWGSRLDMIGIGSETASLWDKNIAYSDHNYGGALTEEPNKDTQKFDNLYALPCHRLLTSKLDIPLWLGEYGYNSNTWIKSVMSACNQPSVLRQDGTIADAPVGWCIWAYKAQAIWSPVTMHVPGSISPLNRYWESYKNNLNTKKPSLDKSFSALMDYAKSSNLRVCAINNDVVDMLTRKNFSSESKPFNNHLTIPGRIAAVEYDLGSDGIAYHDHISTDEAGKGPAGRAWNSGWSYRNDGVDIYPDDDSGSKFVVGEIETGEWLSYTIRCKSGTYMLEIRYSSPDGGRMHIEINRKDIAGQIKLMTTGGWHQYQTASIPVKISANGQAKMRIVFDTSGFNVNWLKFVP